jgi:hypothetical protein
MSRALFISRIKEGLAGLPQSEIDEVVSDYEFHFAEARANGDSEDDIAARLGDPARLAREVREGAGYPALGEEVGAARSVAPPVGDAPARRGMLPLAILVIIGALAGAAYLLSPKIGPVPKLTGEQSKAAVTGPSAPAVPSPKVTVSGGQVLDLGRIEQNELEIVVDGGGQVSASGRVKDLIIRIDGSGRVNFGALEADNIRLELSGTGHAEIAALESADITVSGSGTVSLKTKPKLLKHSVTGSGGIVPSN